MTQQWYVYKNGQQNGPYTREQLNEQAGDGSLSPADMIWTAGMANWSRADQVEGLILAAPPQPGPPPVAPPPPGSLSDQRDGAGYSGATSYRQVSPDRGFLGGSAGKQNKGLVIALALSLVVIVILSGYLLSISSGNGNGEVAVDPDVTSPVAVDVTSSEAVDVNTDPLLGEWVLRDPENENNEAYIGIYPSQFVLGLGSGSSFGGEYWRFNCSPTNYVDLTEAQKEEAINIFGDDIDDTGTSYFIVMDGVDAIAFRGNMGEEASLPAQDWVILPWFIIKLLPNGQVAIINIDSDVLELDRIEREEFKQYLIRAAERPLSYY